MRIECDVIQDILPLYVEKISSEASNRLVEEHLKECEKCKGFLKGMNEDVHLEEVKISNETEIKAVTKTFKKMKKRWIAILIASVLVGGVIGGFVTNECAKIGVCFSNLDAIATAMNYIGYLQDKDYESALVYMTEGYMDTYEDVKIRDIYGQVELYDMYHGDVANMTKEEYCQFRKDTYIDRMDRYDDHTKITEYTFQNAYWYGSGWCIQINVVQESLETEEQWETMMNVFVSDDNKCIDIHGTYAVEDEQWWDLGNWVTIPDIYHK